jgi:hypothetical protein
MASSWHIYVAAQSRSSDAANDGENIVEIDKSNVLLMGPTGSGNSLFFEWRESFIPQNDSIATDWYAFVRICPQEKHCLQKH